MRAFKPLTCRRIRSSKRWSIATVIAMLASMVSPALVPTVHAQTAPVAQGFVIVPDDVRFIFHQIEVAQDHAAPPSSICPGCGTLLGPGRNQVNLFGTPNPQMPLGLRTVDGSYNNLVPVPDQHMFGAADLPFPRLTTPNFRTAETLPFDPDGPGGQNAGDPTSYSQKFGVVADSQPRLISNLIVDQTANNPAAFAAAANPCGSGGFVCQGSTTPDPVTGALFIPNITPDFGLSAPFNLMFTFFGQFFDHGLDLVTKGGGAVIMPLKADDPLFHAPTAANPNPNNFMVMTRATNLPGPDGILGTADDIQEGINTTTPWVDQNQTYTSHPSHQVFLRQYTQDGAGRPIPDGKVLDGSFCSPRGTGIPGDNICDIGNWAQVKAQASTKLGIQLADQDVFNVPLLLTDPYGHFKPGLLRGMPQLVLPGNVLLEGDPSANGGAGVAIPANAFRTGHAFLNDIAHNAEPAPGLVPDADTIIQRFGVDVQPPGTYDNELLDRHFITGDGRGNENIALSTIHQIFHAEHNRLRDDFDRIINTPGVLTAAEVAAWHAVDPGSGWGYGERLFQASRFVTEMEYQHIVFEEFARRMQPLVNPFLGGITSINPAISAEFAHTVYRLGHSMLPEIISRINADGSVNDIRLFDAFLNPVAFNDGGTAGTLPAAQAAGSVVRGLSRTVGNELDEFVTDSVRNTLVGLPLDLAAINIARGRSEGIPSLNSARRQFFSATRNSAVTPYANWFEFGLNLRHRESLVNFVAAYGTDPTITGVTTVAAKRAAATTLVAANGAFMFAPSATSGLDTVDFWIGGLAERQAPFGGLLGSTFNFVFEKQLEDLQNGDRFYYLQRLDGVALRFQLEGNSLAELARRNTDAGDTMAQIFSTADFNFDMASPAFAGTAPVDLGEGMQLLTLADGTKLFFDPLHRGKNVMFNGTEGDDRMQGDIGDDTIYGNGGNDRINGGDGNDRLFGGAGDDVLFGGNGDDVLEGGPGDDALDSGPGFGADILLGGDGNDFLLGGDDGVEHFGGPGDDVMVDGQMRAEGIFGGPGDDWLDGGDGHDGGMFGDNGNVFDLIAGVGAFGGMTIDGGDDVCDGGPGQDNCFGEGGDDIFLNSEGTNKFFGDYGFDWMTIRAWPAGADHTGTTGPAVDLDLLALPNTPVNFNDLRNKYRLVDGASGWDFNDEIEGDSRSNDPTLPPELQNLPGMELIAGTPPLAVPAKNVPGQVNFRGGSGAAKIAGLTQFMSDFGVPLPFNAGNILLGGLGSDLLEGRGGDDLIDGDLWLDVQLRAVLNDGTVKLVWSARDLVADVFSDPQRLNPGNISIIRSLRTPVVPPPDCPAIGQPIGAAKNCDTAVFRGPIANYVITQPLPGIVQVTDTSIRIPIVGVVGKNDGTDRLRNIERLQFSDVTINAPGATAGSTTTSAPSVVGLTQAAAAATINQASLIPASTSANSPTVAIGNVISQSPAAGTSVSFGSTVSFVVALGALAPNVVGLSQAAATTAITTAGMTLGVVTLANSATVPSGSIISQSPPSGTTVAPGSPMALVRSLGPANVIVPNVVNLTQAAAITAITGVGLVQGTVTTASSATVVLGSVISQSPVGGTSAIPGSAVALTVSSGPARPAGLVAAFGFEEASGTTAINSVNASFNGVIRQALRTAGKIGHALWFDGFNDWVTVTDTTASPLDLSTGMTLEAWVNPDVMSGWETVMMKERGVVGEGLLAYALYAHDGAPLSQGFPTPAGYVRLNPVATTVDRAVRGTATIPLGAWTHLATTYDGTNQRFYVNGVLTSTVSSPGTIAVSNGALRIGGNASSTGEFFQGFIDEVRIYNRALSAAEITTDMTTPIVP